MKINNFEFNIFVKDKIIHEYDHQGNVFVEGRKKSNFELQFSNQYLTRVLAIPSVDGLNTLEGTPATIHSKGYIIQPKHTVRIPGWTVDSSNVAKFIFQDKKNSYAKFASPDGSINIGVLGFLVLAEEYNYVDPKYDWYNYLYPTAANSAPNFNRSSAPPSAASGMSVSANSVAPENSTMSREQFSLGTGFGEQAGFQTFNTTFRRGAKLAEMIIYYDDKQGLSSRGIKLTRRTRSDKLPKAFASTGCMPPPGWQK